MSLTGTYQQLLPNDHLADNAVDHREWETEHLRQPLKTAQQEEEEEEKEKEEEEKEKRSTWTN